MSVHAPIIPMVDIINELDLLLKDYESIHGAPKAVEETLSDVRFMRQTVGYLETLFGDKDLALHLPTHATKILDGLKKTLKADLKSLHTTLKKWPNPPTLAAMVGFGIIQTNEVKALRGRIIAAQRQFTVLLSTLNVLNPEVIEGGLSMPFSLSDAGAAEIASSLEVEYEESPSMAPACVELIETLRALPPTLRLSHLVQKLEHIHQLSTEFSQSAFGDDIHSILVLAKELDGRLLAENHFAKEVRKEIHTMIDIEIKMLLHELCLLPSLIEDGLFRPNREYVASDDFNVESTPARPHYGTLPIHDFLQDHELVFMMILTVVAGSRMSEQDPRHQGGTRRDEDDGFEGAVAAVMERLARHSGRVNGWTEVRRHIGESKR